MNKCFVILILLNTVGCSSFMPRKTMAHSKKIPFKERKALVEKAATGDAYAAWSIWNHHAFFSRKKKQEAKWLDRAAQLGHPQAQRWLAYEIIERGRPYQLFGKTPKDASFKLLTAASKTDGVAAYDLGKRHYEGYFGAVDRHMKALEAFQLGASLHNAQCWKPLAEILHIGVGGEPDQSDAYYYICLATQCRFGDEEHWDLRRKIEAELSLAQAQTIWERVDSYISKERKRSGGRINPPPFGGTGILENKWNERLKATDAYEAQHRNKLKRSLR